LAVGDYPKQTGLVNDFAGILDPAGKARLTSALEGLEKTKNFVLVVVTVKSLDGRPVEDYTVGLANAWGIGQKGKNNGVVFLVSTGDRALRVENGYGAEGTLTDIESKLLMEEKVVPLLKEGRISDGVVVGTEALAAKLGGGAVSADAVKKKEPKIPVSLIIAIIVVVLILMCFPAGREFLWVVLQVAVSSSDKGGGGNSKGSSGSGGGKFGGGGATSKW
jgi:uncharacterized protein